MRRSRQGKFSPVAERLLYTPEYSKFPDEGERSDEHPEEPGDGVSTAFSNGRDRRPRAIAEHREPGSEEQRAKEHTAELRRLHVDGRSSRRGPGVHR